MDFPPAFKNVIEENNFGDSERKSPFQELVLPAVVVTLAALALISFGSPLFRTLGFEFSASMATVLSLLVGLRAARSVRFDSRRSSWAMSGKATWEGLLLSLIPLILSLISTLSIPNCALWDGLVFYLEVAIPSAILAAMFGSAIGLVTRTQKSSTWGFLAFWFLTFGLSLLPGYIFPQIYTYGWQYGYFPGLVWDEALTLTRTYLIFRIECFAFAIALLLAAQAFARKRAAIIAKPTFAYGALVTMIVLASILNDKYGIVCTHTRLEQNLSAHIVIDAHCTIFYRPSGLFPEEVAKLKDDTRWYLHAIRSRLALGDSSRDIHIYLYSTADDMFEYVGTRSASISKPWLSELHITRANLSSLKHELVHVLLRESGSFPFYASWSTGLTEGVAMALEPRFGSMRTLDEHAALILKLKLATGVRDVMSFSGFASNSSAKSYVLAGSFAKFLLAKYGSKPYVKLYRSLDYDLEYHRSLEQLETDWKVSLASSVHTVSSNDSLRTQFYFGGSSILFQPCLRRIGKWTRSAEELMSLSNYRAADSLYALVLAESGSRTALGGRVTAQLRLGRPEIAARILDTTSFAHESRQRTSLHLVKAEIALLLGDTTKAFAEFSTAEEIGLDEAYFVRAHIFDALLRSEQTKLVGIGVWQKFVTAIYTKDGSKDRRAILDALGYNIMFTPTPPEFDVLRAQASASSGEYRRAIAHYESALAKLNARAETGALSNYDSTFRSIIALKARELGSRGPMPTPPVEVRAAFIEEEAEIIEEQNFLRPH
ncbi:MAG: hypothetical protein ABI444_07560 [Candidatus Kapaibacterium sp.]